MTNDKSAARSRQAKLAAIQAEKVAAKRRERTLRIAIVTSLTAVAAVVIGLTATSHPSHATTHPNNVNALDNAANPGQLDPSGLQVSNAPWAPEYTHLPARLKALNLPPNGDETYHIHAHLAVFVDGKPVEVPMNVGISAADRLESPMHTHDTTGVVHMEAASPSQRFSVGAFFDLWGVKITPTTLGGYSNSGGKTVQIYLNGKPVADPFQARLSNHDNVVVGYGTPGSVPKTVP